MHEMKLHPSPFEKIKNGTKTIELRLYDEKRQQLREGDGIAFTNTASGERICATVKKLHRFDSFAALYRTLPLLQCGYTAENIASADPSDMSRYYSAEEQHKYGVVGIELFPPERCAAENAAPKKLYIPLMNSAVREDTRAEYLEQLSAFRDAHLFFAVDRQMFFSRGAARAAMCRLLQENIAFFQKHGYHVGIWVQAFGFGDPLQGENARVAKNYTRLRSVGGREKPDSDMLCPEDPQFMADYLEFVRDMAGCGGEMLMLDDDLCLSVRPGIGCFCERHLALIEQELGEPLRGDLPTLLFTGGQNRYRDAWLTVMGNTLRRFARRVREAIDEIAPNLRAGFCAGYTSWDIEGVDALELTRILAGNTAPFLRFTGAPYWAAASVDRFRGQPLAAIVEETRAQEQFCRASGVEVFFECDSYPRPRYTVPSSLLECFALPLYASGGMGELSYLFDYHSSPAYETGYAKHRRHHQPLYDFIAAHFADKTPYGVRVYHEMKKIAQAELSAPVDEKAIMAMHFNRGAELLGVHGIPTVYGQDAPCGIATGEEARYIDTLPQKLVLDAKAAQILQEKGIDVGFSHMTVAPAPLFEYADNEKCLLHGSASDAYYSMTLKEGVRVLGEFEAGELRYPSAYLYESGGTEFLVYSFDMDKIPHRAAVLLSYVRGEQLYRFFGGISYMERSPGVYQLCKKGNGETAILLVNISQDPIIDGRLHTDRGYGTAEIFNATGTLRGSVLQFDSVIPPYGACAAVLR
ncbi:MAG: ASCH domain-containing protein [Clostridia bacterium]|nr:ASCH domain-containing protein [Clostridia bacterium]